MNWKRLLIASLTRSKYKSFLEDTKDPKSVRNRLWEKEIVPILHRSPYWSALIQNPNPSLNDFEITTYEHYQEGLLAAQNDTDQPFNGESLIFWSETSGTAGVRKFFPITASFQKQFQRTMPPFIYSLTQRFSGFFKEKILYLVAVDANKSSPAGIPSGWISNFNYRHLPPFIKRFYALPDEVFANDELFELWAPLYALASDLSALFAVTPMVIDSFYERCSIGFNKYLPYLMGKQNLPLDLPPIKITKKRRNHLQKLAQSQSKLTFEELWPSLTLAACWTSGLCHYPAQQLQNRMGEQIRLVDGAYSATEGWLTVPLDNNHRGGILHPGAHIVEFIEEGQEIRKQHLLQCWELEVGKKYEIFLTTAMGFVRYQLKDVVQCTGFLNKAPQLEFCYKTQLLKLESCAITGQELQKMLESVGFNLFPHWYFARNSLGNRIVLVTDTTAGLNDSLLHDLHTQLIQISPTYAHSVSTGEVIPIALLQLPLEELLVDSHAQTKPKLISHRVVTEL
jgi:hypothetical protein